jgi:hypothetical protein
MNRHGRGKWVEVCQTCGCPSVVTRNDDNPENERTVWAYETLDLLQEEVRILSAIIDAGMPRSLRDALRGHYDPARGRIIDWCDETRRAEDDD